MTVWLVLFAALGFGALVTLAITLAAGSAAKAAKRWEDINMARIGVPTMPPLRLRAAAMGNDVVVWFEPVDPYVWRLTSDLDP